MMEKPFGRVAAVIVTFNRKELLSQNLQMLQKQTLLPDMIYIIDNHSTDGTAEHLQANGFFESLPIDYVYLNENTGGAGGFSFGTQRAYEAGFDFVWLMDDDGKPCNERTFEILQKKAISLYKSGSRHLMLNSLVTYDGYHLAFGLSIDDDTLCKLRDDEDFFLAGKINPFNSTLISREVFERVGFPNKDFFICVDEMDFRLRCRLAAVVIGTVGASLYCHPAFARVEKSFLGKKLTVSNFSANKRYYIIRNKTYSYFVVNRQKGMWLKEMVRDFAAVLFFEKQRMQKIGKMLRGIHDGLKGRLGKTISL